MILAFSIAVSGVGELGEHAASNSPEDAKTGSVARAVAAAYDVGAQLWFAAPALVNVHRN